MVIKLELTNAQYQQLADLVGKSRAIMQAHDTGEISVPTAQNDVKIEWTPQAVEIQIPD